MSIDCQLNFSTTKESTLQVFWSKMHILHFYFVGQKRETAHHETNHGICTGQTGKNTFNVFNGSGYFFSKMRRICSPIAWYSSNEYKCNLFWSSLTFLYINFKNYTHHLWRIWSTKMIFWYVYTTIIYLQYSPAALWK